MNRARLMRAGHGMLAGRGTAALPPAKNLALPVDQLPEEFEILVVDIHRPGPGASMKIGSFRLTFVRGLAFFLANFANLPDLGLAGGIEKLQKIVKQE